MQNRKLCLANPISLPVSGAPVLACGAWLKNTVCVTRGRWAYVSQLHGNLDGADARVRLEHSVEHLCASLGVKPEVVAHDLHPDFYSTQFAQTYAAHRGLRTLAVQHHHAHVASVCAEHGMIAPVLGLALDGMGMGMDGAPWGGELLRVEGNEFQRLGHLDFLAMPGGDRAAREPWRMAAAVWFKAGRGEEIAQRFSSWPGAETVAAMLNRGLNCPVTSSMGRLFDAAAGLLGVCGIQDFEAQAAVRLQSLALAHGPVSPLSDGYRIMGNSLSGQSSVLDFSSLLAALMDCRATSYGAALFHSTVAAGLAEWVGRVAGEHHLECIVLSGGCFHNEILKRTLSDRLSMIGLQVLVAQQMQPDDSAISLGQAWVALQQASQ